MSNILVDALPNAVEINGREVRIETDFRACLRVIMAFEDPELTDQEKSLVLLENLYAKPWPEPLSIALGQGIKFLNGGKIEMADELGPRIYSFEKDAQFIFAAFRQTHGLSLDTEQMHWWKFLALFMDIGSETTFANLIGLRKRLKTGKATKEERRAANEIRDLVELSDFDRRSLEEKEQEAEFLALVMKGKNGKM